MATLGFLEAIGAERAKNKKRFDQIDETISALEAERKAIADREKMLETVGELYQQSQKVIEEARNAQNRLTPRAAQTATTGSDIEDRFSIDLKASDLVEG